MEGDVANKRSMSDVEANLVARYVATGDMVFMRPPAPIPFHTPEQLAAALRLGEANHVFGKALRAGDAPGRDKWRKTLGRFVAALALCGGLLFLIGVARAPAETA